MNKRTVFILLLLAALDSGKAEAASFTVTNDSSWGTAVTGVNNSTDSSNEISFSSNSPLTVSSAQTISKDKPLEFSIPGAGFTLGTSAEQSSIKNILTFSGGAVTTMPSGLTMSMSYKQSPASDDLATSVIQSTGGTALNFTGFGSTVTNTTSIYAQTRTKSYESYGMKSSGALAIQGDFTGSVASALIIDSRSKYITATAVGIGTVGDYSVGTQGGSVTASVTLPVLSEAIVTGLDLTSVMSSSISRLTGIVSASILSGPFDRSDVYGIHVKGVNGGTGQTLTIGSIESGASISATNGGDTSTYGNSHNTYGIFLEDADLIISNDMAGTITGYDASINATGTHQVNINGNLSGTLNGNVWARLSIGGSLSGTINGDVDHLNLLGNLTGNINGTLRDVSITGDVTGRIGNISLEDWSSRMSIGTISGTVGYINCRNDLENFVDYNVYHPLFSITNFKGTITDGIAFGSYRDWYYYNEVDQFATVNFKITNFNGRIERLSNIDSEVVAAISSASSNNFLTLDTLDGTLKVTDGYYGYGIYGGTVTLGTVRPNGNITVGGSGSWLSGSPFSGKAAGIFLFSLQSGDNGSPYFYFDDAPETNRLNITGAFNGTVSVAGPTNPNTLFSGIADNGIAAGMYAYNGITGANNNTPARIGGTISVEGDGYTLGLGASNGPINVDISGIISAVDRTGSGRGYAILSRWVGIPDPYGSYVPGLNEYLVSFSNNVADNVTISGSGNLNGNVDLGWGNDRLAMTGGRIDGSVDFGQGGHYYNDEWYIISLYDGSGDDTLTMSNGATIAGPFIHFGAGEDRMILSGHADVSGVRSIDGGAGLTFDGLGSEWQEFTEFDNDTLTMSGWSTTKGFNGTVTGWEKIEVKDNSDVYLGPTPDVNSQMTFSASAGQTLQMTIDAGSIVRATGASPGRYVIDGNLTNNGTVSMVDKGADDRVTVTGNYVGGTGYLRLDVALGDDHIMGSSNLDALDLLVVGTAAGQTTLRVNNTSLLQKVSLTPASTGILVVRVTGSNIVDSLDPAKKQFVLDKSNFTSGTQIDVVQVGDDWYLVVTNEGETITDPVPTPTPDPTPTPTPTPVIPDPSPVPPPAEQQVVESSVYGVMALGYESMPRFHERQAYGWSAPGQEREPASWWMRTTGSRYTSGLASGGVDTRVSGYRSTMQVGADLSACGCGGTLYRTGVFAGTGYLTADSYGIGGAKAGHTDVYSMGVGGYASVEHRGRWYAEGVVQASSYDISSSFTGNAVKSGSGTWGGAASVEAGAYVKVSEGFRLEPQAQVMWQRIAGYSMRIDPASMAKVSSMTGLTGRLGVTGTVMPEGWCVSPIVELNAVREFGDDAKVSWEQIGQTYTVKTDRTWLGGALGIVSRNSRPECLEYFVKAGLMAGVDGHNGRDWTITAGIRKSW